MNPFDKEWIKLNVGGRQFVTTRSTLCTKEPGSMLARMFSHQSPSLQDEHGAYLIDRSPTYFEPILGYLRHGKLIVDHNINLDGVREEAKFYNIGSLIRILDEEIDRINLIKAKNLSLDNNNKNSRLNNNDEQTMPPLTRSDVVRAIMSTPGGTELRFQGLNLAGANLSKLDLRSVNLKYANLKCSCLKGADLSQANLERADLSQANLEGVKLTGANLRHTNLEGANLRAITIQHQQHHHPHQHPSPHHQQHNSNNNNNNVAAADQQHQLGQLQQPNHQLLPQYDNNFLPQYDTLPSSPKAQFECANMRSCNLEGSQMAYANLRRATLNNANLQNCNLYGAVLTGADLANCDLTGCNLLEANVSNANFKGATLNETIQ